MASELVNFATVKYRTAILYQLLSILCNHALSSPTLPYFNWLVNLNFIWPILINCNVKIQVKISRLRPKNIFTGIKLVFKNVFRLTMGSFILKISCC